MQSYSARPHLGIIMDGNGRWATAKGLSRSRGHEAGVRAIRPVVEAAADAGVGVVTLFAFSADNWKRPKPEVAILMGLLRRYLDEELESLRQSGIRVTLVGRRDRLPGGMAERIARAEAETADRSRLHLRIAFDYSGREAILAAARSSPVASDRDAFGRLVSGDDAGRRRPSDPHRRRKTAQRLHALGMRLRGTPFRRPHVAGFSGPTI